jgi:hypothetical protein
VRNLLARGRCIAHRRISSVHVLFSRIWYKPDAVARRVPKGRDRVIRHLRARYRFSRLAARTALVHAVTPFGIHAQRRTRSGRDGAPEEPVPSHGSAMRLALARRDRQSRGDIHRMTAFPWIRDAPRLGSA